MDAPELSFDFIDDAALVRVLEEYYEQTKSATAAESYLGVIGGFGSLLEGLLTWALLRTEDESMASKKAPRDRDGKVLEVRQWGLAKLIDVSIDLGPIGKTVKDAS